MVLALEQQADDDRRQRPRQRIGRQHREHDREPERGEQEFCRPFEEHHRGEHAADRERRDHGRHRNAGGAVQRRRGETHAFAAQPVGVLDRHRRIVDQDADRKRHAAERHGVERVAHEVEDDDRREDRQRNRDQDDQGRPPRAEKQQDHQPGEPGRDRSLAEHAGDRCGDELRLIEQLVDAQSGRRGSAGGLEDLADSVDDRNGRGVAVLEDAQQDGAPAVVADDVLLHRPAVVHLADILEEHRLPVGVFDRNVVEVGDAHGHRIGAHRVLRVADLGETRRQSQVLSIDRVHHVRRGQASGLELDRVDVDHDLPVLAAVGGRKGHARHRGKLLAQVVEPVVVELLLAEAVGR